MFLKNVFLSVAVISQSETASLMKRVNIQISMSKYNLITDTLHYWEMESRTYKERLLVIMAWYMKSYT